MSREGIDEAIAVTQQLDRIEDVLHRHGVRWNCAVEPTTAMLEDLRAVLGGDSVLEQRLAEASKRESRHLQELEALRGERDRLTTLLAKAGDAPKRHWVRLTCDRCSSAVEFTSTLAYPENERSEVLANAARDLGWHLTAVTTLALFAEYEDDGNAAPGLLDRDMCPACCKLLGLKERAK